VNQREMKLLEKAFIAELEEAAGISVGLMQSKSKLVEQLVQNGYLVKDRKTIGGRFPVTVHGYRLTHLGRITYCTSG
jgi:hypothetical protein